MPSAPKPIHPLSDFPPGCPYEVRIILGRACEKYQFQSEILDLLRYVVSEIMPLFFNLVGNQALRPDSAWQMAMAIVRRLLNRNVGGSHAVARERSYKLEMELLKTEEWKSFERQMQKASLRREAEVRDTGIPDRAGQENAPIGKKQEPPAAREAGSKLLADVNIPSHVDRANEKPVDAKKFQLGAWANKRLMEAREIASRLRGGATEAEACEPNPDFFKEVLEKLTAQRRASFFADAKRKINDLGLMEYIADVKELKASTMSDYRKYFLKHSRTQPTPETRSKR